jgi:NADPH2:quinone reductase
MTLSNTPVIEIERTGDPDVLTPGLRRLPLPGPGEVLIDNRVAAVNFVDTLIRSGAMPPGMMPSLPHVPGVEGAGIVAALGDGVTGLAVGSKVAWMGPVGVGGYGGRVVVRSEYCVPVADILALETAAAIPVNAMTAWHMLVNLGGMDRLVQSRRDLGLPAPSVLIHSAAGGVGTLAVQLARHLGAAVIATCSAGKLEFVRALGADTVLDHRREDLASQILAATAGRGVDLSLNPVAGPTLRRDLGLLAPMGGVILFGFMAGLPEGDFATDLAGAITRSVFLRVSDIYSYFNTDAAAFSADLRRVLDLAATGVLTPRVTALPLARAGEAHRLLESGQSMGKLVLAVG